ncbi:MAG: MarR family winged helix-turn-helix transcriptional regulator [Candidatus Methylacidiphilales bacterium]
MKSKAILQQLINDLSNFELENDESKELNYGDFVAYISSKIQSGTTEIRNLRGEEEKWIDEQYKDSQTDIVIFITLLSRYAKVYIKKALKNSLVQTADEFSYLIVLMTHESLSKSDLIQKNVMEKTSGVEVIKRLINNGLIYQFEDKDDKRIVRVAITENGKLEIIKLLPNMAKVSKIVSANLTPNDLLILTHLLKKLDLYHNDLYINKKNMDLDSLLADNS